MPGETIKTLTVGLVAKTEKFDRRMKRVERKLDKLRKGVGFLNIGFGKLAALAGGGFLISYIKQASDAADKTIKFARGIGINVERLQELEFAASISGVSAERLRRALTFMSRSVAEASNLPKPLGESAVAFKILEINVHEFKKLKPAEQIRELATRFSGLNDSQKASLASSRIFGRQFVEMLRVLGQGADRLGVLAQEARDLGIVFTAQELSNIEAFNDEFDRMGRIFQGVIKAALVEIGPLVTGILKEFRKWIIASGGIKNVVLGSLEAIATAAGKVLDLFSKIENIGGGPSNADLQNAVDFAQHRFDLAVALGKSDATIRVRLKELTRATTAARKGTVVSDNESSIRALFARLRAAGQGTPNNLGGGDPEDPLPGVEKVSAFGQRIEGAFKSAVSRGLLGGTSDVLEQFKQAILGAVAGAVAEGLVGKEGLNIAGNVTDFFASASPKSSVPGQRAAAGATP